jgi:predicted kinase
MKRSEMILIIASELVHEFTNFMDFDDAQSMAEIVLARVEDEGMLPPYNNSWEPETPRMIVLVGNIGSGKSTWASKQIGYEVINQDILGSREKCIKLAQQYLKEGKSVIIDRTNINRKQRSYWLAIASNFNIEPTCINFSNDKELAINMVKNRKNHKTITKDVSSEKINDIFDSFEKSYEAPEPLEGFCNIDYVYNFEKLP